MIPVKKHVATLGRKNSLLIGTHLIQNKRIYSVWQELGHDKINVVIPTQNMTAGHAEQPKDLGLCLLGWCVFFFLLSNKLFRFSVFLALLWTFDVFNSARSTWRVRIQSKSCCWLCHKSPGIIRSADGIQTFTWTRAEELPPPTHLKPHFIHSAHKSRLVSRWRRKSRCRAEELSSAHPLPGLGVMLCLHCKDQHDRAQSLILVSLSRSNSLPIFSSVFETVIDLKKKRCLKCTIIVRQISFLVLN